MAAVLELTKRVAWDFYAQMCSDDTCRAAYAQQCMVVVVEVKDLQTLQKYVEGRKKIGFYFSPLLHAARDGAGGMPLSDATKQYIKDSLARCSSTDRRPTTVYVVVSIMEPPRQCTLALPDVDRMWADMQQPPTGVTLVPYLPGMGSEVQSLNHHICAACGKADSRKLCGKCMGVRYCSRECQLSHLKAHKRQCKP